MRYAAYRTPPRGRRGSVILMTVGLLVIIGMLGVTFLVVAHMDARQTRALAAKAPADPVAGGIVQQLRQKLLEDLYIDNTDGPYGAYTGSTNADKWAQFVDYPSDGIDRWLADSALEIINASACKFSHISELNESLTQPAGVMFAWDGSDNKWLASLPGREGADTDGDGWADAVLYDTNVTNAEGDKYYAAVRVIDLGGLICVNTAAEPNNPADPNKAAKPTAPVNIDLRSFLGGALYDTLHGARCNGADPDDLGLLATRAAGKLLQPDSPYLPFGIGDEMFLRWAQPLATAPPTAAGRLFALYEPYRLNPPIADQGRRLLTTFNCSRILVRRPDSAGGWTRRLLLEQTTALDDSAVRQRLYEQLFVLLGNAKKKIAAHFVANLWAYISSAPARDNAFAFQPNIPGTSNPESFTVYGLVEQPVISEAYAYSLADSNAGAPPLAGDDGYAYAIEIYNPTEKNIELAYDSGNSKGYKLKIGTDEYEFPNITLAPRQRAVVYNVGGKVVEGASRRPALAGDFGFDGIANASEWASLDFSDGRSVRLVRIVDSETIPIDRVSGSDFGYDISDRKTNDNKANEVLKNGRRDDDATRQRCTVGGQYAMVEVGISDRTDHKLGAQNILTPAQVAEVDDKIWRGFPIERLEEVPTDLGDLGKIYVIGPEEGGDDFPLAAAQYAKDVSRGRPDFKGALTTPAPSTAYPDVPWATFLNEFIELVPPDGTRPNADGDATRIYGRININTAPLEVLRQLPFPTQATIGSVNIAFDPAVAAEYIIAYRDRLNITGGPDYSSGRSGPGASNITSLRDTSDFRGFLTAGEVAIPLADYANQVIDSSVGLAAAQQAADYLEARDSLYRAVSNLITVNSDVFAAYILVQLRDGLTEAVKHTWNYVAVLDRSNCRQTGQPGVPGDLPAVLLFSEVK